MREILCLICFIFDFLSLSQTNLFHVSPRNMSFESYKGDFDGDFGSIRALARNMFEDESTVIPDLPSQREVSTSMHQS